MNYNTLLFFFMIGIIGFNIVNCLQCTHQYQCQSVTDNYNFVECGDDLSCACLSDQGFTGLATSESKCRCESPKNVYWSNGSPYCLSLEQSAAEQNREAVLEQAIQTVYNSLIWPQPVQIMTELLTGENTFINQFFEESKAEGRVDPVGTFNDFEGLVEYFYGTVWQGFARISSVDMRKIVVQDNEVSVRVNLFFDYYSPDLSTIVNSSNMTQTGIFTFNENNKVEKVELIIHNLGRLSDPTFPESTQSISTICYLILNQAQCNENHDPTGYYTDFNDCVSFLSSVEFGSWSKIAYTNSALCRYYHSLLAIARPDIHCEHAGKTSSKCYDRPYEDYYEKEY